MDRHTSTIGSRARKAVTSRRAFLRAAFAGGAYMVGVGRGFADTREDRRMPRAVVCDVNGTLLDVGALEPHFKDVFGDGRVLQEWFGTVLLYSEVATLAGPYADFASIGGAALDMTAAARGVTLSPTDRGRILQGMLSLPAHPDVRDGLQAMRDAGLPAGHLDQFRHGVGAGTTRERRSHHVLRAGVLRGHGAALQAGRRGVLVRGGVAWSSC